MKPLAKGASVRARLESAAQALTLPTMLVRRQISDVASPECAREFLAAVPHAECVQVSGAGHIVAGDSNHVFTEGHI
jgi:pimeloyl-ACP methyl ester carboxylesterase